MLLHEKSHIYYIHRLKNINDVAAIEYVALPVPLAWP
jgi:hypothetical protein